MRPVIELNDVKKTYRMGDTDVRALAGVTLTIERGDFVAIMGPSGSGKSTLMHVLGLLDPPQSGSYRLLGTEVRDLSEDALAELRAATIGFVFQQFNLLPRTSAEENVRLPLLYRGGAPAPCDPRRLLDEVGLGARADHHPNELSGGQQQRVAIARALVNAPEILLADEPTGNLDSGSEAEILGLLKRLNARGITVIVVTHEEEVAAHARRVIRMRDGRVQSDERRAPLAIAGESGPREIPVRKHRVAHEIATHARQGLRALLANKVRSGLSMLGILIGVTAVVAMLAIGRGARESIESSLSSLGTNLLTVMAGGFHAPGGATLEAGSVTRFTIEDANEIARTVPYLRTAAPVVQGKARAAFGNKNWSTSVTGATPEYPTMHNSPTELGRFFSHADDASRALVAVIGTTVAREIFGVRNPVGETIKINKINFRVIGLLKSKGVQGPRDQDDVVIVPLSTAMRRLLGKDYVDSIDIQVSDGAHMSIVEDATRALLVRRHRLPASQEDSFTIRNMAEIQAALSSTSNVLSGLLACIAAISLLVGGIGIMNIMLVSVTERTREIGLRKALGARARDIMLQFLVEAALVSALGGIIGVGLGWAVTTAVTLIFGWAAHMSAASIVLAIVFSGGIGVVFGLWPAAKAAALSPINALRYE